MSCSKPVKPTATFTMVTPSAEPVKDHKSCVGTDFYTAMRAYSITKHDETKFFLSLTFYADNEKGVRRVVTLSIWETLLGDDECLPVERILPDTVTELDGEVLKMIHCQATVDRMRKSKKAQVAHFFSTNDIAMFDSFTKGHKTGRCVEQDAICESKTLFIRRQTLEDGGENVFKVVMESPRVCPYMLEALLGREDNYVRFIKDIPDDLTDEEKKAHKKALLVEVREKIKDLGREEFTNRFLDWLDLNLELPESTDPRIFKLGVGQAIPMTTFQAVELWDSISGGCFLAAAAKNFAGNPVNLRLALTCDAQTFLCEISPDDVRWAVSPNDPKVKIPKGEEKRLGWCATTPEGILWSHQIMASHGGQQKEMVEMLAEATRTANACKSSDKLIHDAMIDKALRILTEGLNKYKFGILGLTKAILLAIYRKDIQFPEALDDKLATFYEKLGIAWELEEVDIKLQVQPEYDPFELLLSVGECGDCVRIM